MKNKFLKGLAASFALVISGVANAGLITVDITETLIWGDENTPGYVMQRLNEDVAGIIDLTSSDVISNPSGWRGHADIDITASGLVTLTGREPSGFANYTNAFFDFSNILFSDVEVITGVSVIDGTGIFDGQYGGYPSPIISFTSNSFSIDYRPYPEELNFGEGQIAQFQLQIESVNVPEPSTLVVFALGLMGLASRKFKKQA